MAFQLIRTTEHDCPLANRNELLWGELTAAGALDNFMLG